MTPQLAQAAARPKRRGTVAIDRDLAWRLWTEAGAVNTASWARQQRDLDQLGARCEQLAAELSHATAKVGASGRKGLLLVGRAARLLVLAHQDLRFDPSLWQEGRYLQRRLLNTPGRVSRHALFVALMLRETPGLTKAPDAWVELAQDLVIDDDTGAPRWRRRKFWQKVLARWAAVAPISKRRRI